jgi:hypothetical protein
VTLCELLGHTWKHLNPESVYILDSFPIAVCDNYRIPRAKLYRHEVYRGYLASKKRYFDGRKIHLRVTKDGQPSECDLTPGSYRDVRGLKTFQLDLPEGSHIYADKGYHDDALEEALLEAVEIQFCPLRKQNAKRAVPPYFA